MNGYSLIFQVVIIAALSLVFGVVVAATVRFAMTAVHWRPRRHLPRAHRG
ncbi:MAG TPA: hypothetical protein VMD29_12800 [Terracidiphilus sp.]|jgi:hypothetical protein|nr:hypothetical protein [Terracidiphilus sp.]